MKELLKKYFQHLAFFYRYLGLRIVWLLLLSITVGVLDGFGLSMFLPLLQLVSGAEGDSKEGLGGMAFLVDGLETLGIELNLYSVLALLTILFAIKGVLSFIRSYYDTSSRFYFMRRLRLYLMELFTSYSYTAFSSANVGRIQNVMTGELNKLAAGSRAYLQTMQLYVMVMVYSTLAALSNFQFAIIVAVGVLITNFFFRTFYKKTSASSGSLSSKDNAFHGLLSQFLNSYKYLKATSKIFDYKQRVDSNIRSIEAENKKIGYYGALLGAVREPVMVLVVCLVILFQTTVLSIPLGGIILSLLFFYRAMNNIVLLQTSWNTFLVYVGAIGNIKDFITDLKSNQERNGTNVFQSPVEELNLEKVSFAYGTRTVLDNIDLQIKKNMTVAFVGQSGSGKTTLVNILCGLFYPQQGSFTINGQDIHTIKKATIQKHIGYITQEPVIYDDSLYNNVTFWAEKNEENLGRFRQAIEQSAVSEFMVQLPDAEDTRLGNNGVQLSGGQKQRISIARELFKDIQILVMDEATSALDSETEKIIQENIDRLKGKLTIIIVAHRLSTIKGADLVLVMSEGRIIEQGSYDHLINYSTTFQRMVNLQEL